MTTTPRKNPARHLRVSDLRGLAKLATQATVGVTGIAEGLHQAIHRTMGLPADQEKARTRGLTGLVYRSIHGVTAGVAKSIDVALTALTPLLDRVDAEKPETPERELVLAVLNGVMGDRLVDTDNPFATAMSFHHGGKALRLDRKITLPGASGHVLLLVHGLCMNDQQWRIERDGTSHDHGDILADALGCTPVYLRYNTGRHTSENGAELAQKLEQLVARWPVPVTALSIVVHSMGGLVSRSACHYAEAGGLAWRERLRHLVFLGTPHHGAPLEKAGNWLDVLLGSMPYSAPFAKLGQLRSAGITDLRYGHVLDEDWHGRDRFRRQPDSRTPVPLPAGVACYALAATTAKQRSPLADRLIGDGLVPLPSGLGQHEDSRRDLNFPKHAQHIVYDTGHIALLSSPAVSAQLLKWLAPSSPN